MSDSVTGSEAHPYGYEPQDGEANAEWCRRQLEHPTLARYLTLRDAAMKREAVDAFIENELAGLLAGALEQMSWLSPPAIRSNTPEARQLAAKIAELRDG